MKKKIIIFLIVIFVPSQILASIKENIIKNIEGIDNLSFNFEQNINGKTENGNCIVQYPKKIFCKYDLKNGKILVSNGKSLVIKTVSSYYLYPLNKTPLNLILDKNFIVEKVQNSKERIIDKKFINFNFDDQGNRINIFFDIKTFNLIGWQTLDMYQNLSITYLNSIRKNKNIKTNLFNLPKRN